VSSFVPETLERIAGLAPAWPRWLNAWDLSTETIRTAVDLECRAISVDFHAIDAGSAAAVRSAGLDLAGWTVRRRATYGRLQRLGVVAACVEAAALDG
jgi:glycerophosphoryl diester phosphodiesterase